MDLSPDILTWGERAVLTLRQLYEGYGYRRYRIEKFEPYDLYRENRNFLNEETAITFPDSRGRLMALKPDVTMKAVRNTLNFFKDVCRRHDLPMSNEGGENVWIPTILGTFRPTWLCLTSQDRRLLAQAEKIAAVGVRSLKDCHAGMVVRMLGRQKNLQGKPIVSLEVVKERLLCLTQVIQVSCCDYENPFA